MNDYNCRNDLYRRWTKDAIVCFERKFHCEGCLLNEFCKNPMDENIYNIKAMKFSVLRLFARHGKPPINVDCWANPKNEYFLQKWLGEEVGENNAEFKKEKYSAEFKKIF